MNFNIKSNLIEKVFPLWKLDGGFLISKSSDVTICLELTLIESFTSDVDRYKTLHNCFVSGMRDFPNYTIIHKQDIYTYSKVDLQQSGNSFLSSAYASHFQGRSFLSHRSFLFITLSCKANMETTSVLSSLCRNRLIPKEQMDENRLNDFTQAVSRFIQILSDNGIYVRRIEDSELLGDDLQLGIIEQYLNLKFSGGTVLSDLHVEDGCLMVGDNYVSCHSIADLDAVPSFVCSCSNNSKLSSPPNFHVPQSFTADLGLSLNCEHIFNQYYFLEDDKKILDSIRQKGKLQQAFSNASRANSLNLQRNMEFLDEAYEGQKRAVKCAFNVITWDKNWNKLLDKNALVEAAMSKINCCTKTKTEKIVPQVFWGGIPGAASQYPKELTFLTFLEQACCFLNFDTNYKNMVGSSDFGIYLTDRLAGVPVRIDLDDYPKKKGWIDNRNKVIIGPSGSGKSFFTNNLVRQYWEQGCHVVLVDVGDSYQGLCHLINEETNSDDGLYFTYTEDKPLSFNPFYEKNYEYSEEKKEQLLTLIKTLWKGDMGLSNTESTHIKVAIYNYIDVICDDRSITPCFDTFYHYLISIFKPYIQNELCVRVENFDVDDLIQVLKPFESGGMFGHLLNSKEELNLLEKRFIVFELDNIKDNKTLFPIVTLIIMATFMDKIRRLPSDQRKLMLIEEAWQAIAKEGMATFIGYLYRTARKHFGEIAIVTQEPDDLVGNKFIKDIMITQSHCKILLDLRDFKEKVSIIQEILSLSKKEQNILFSVNNNLNFTSRSRYKEVFISLRNFCAVYGVEVSDEEYCTFTTDKEEKGRLQNLMRENGNSILKAIPCYIKQFKS